jgi:hypothetical protein
MLSWCVFNSNFVPKNNLANIAESLEFLAQSCRIVGAIINCKVSKRQLTEFNQFLWYSASFKSRQLEQKERMDMVI